MLRIVFATALAVAAAGPALASDRAYTPQQITDALKAGCSVHQTHVPAGKIATAPAIVRCKQARLVEAVNRTPAPREGQRSEVE